MFHGIVNRGDGWFRVITSLKLHEKDNILEEFVGGPYWPAFMEHFFPDRYRVEVRKIHGKGLNGVKSDDPKSALIPTAQEVIRWSTATDQYSIRIKNAEVKNNTTWLHELENIGLIIGNSKKMSKRLLELVRLSCAAMYIPKNKLKVEEIDHISLGRIDSDVDGISAISMSLAVRCILANPMATEEWVQEQIEKIYSGETTVVQLRVLTPSGLIKGNALVLPDGMMKGFDIRTFAPNIKSEIRTVGWNWITIEPSYSILPVKSDDLTHAIYQEVNGLYAGDNLIKPLENVLDNAFEDLKSGKRSRWMTKLVDSAEIVVRSDSGSQEDRYRTPKSTLKMVQTAIAKLDKLGIPFESSQTLRYLTVNGLSMQFLGHETGVVGNVWTQKNKHWMPVEWAYSAHIITQEVLEIFGFKTTKGHWGYYHEKTHCFVVPGDYFARNLVNHGGPDQDDTVKVHVRIVDFGDRQQLMAFILRNPNDFGEWSMIPIRKYGPVFHNYTEVPPTINYQELITKVPQMTTLNAQNAITYGQLPGTASLVIGKKYSLADESRCRLASMNFPGGVGSSVLPKMMWYALNKTYIPYCIATNEEIIDALQQGLATPSDVLLIKNWAEKTVKDLLVNHGKNGTKMDMFWMQTRLPDKYAKDLDATSIEDSPWCQLHIQREILVRTKVSAMLDFINDNIVMPEVLVNLNFTEEEIETATKDIEKMSTKCSTMSAAEWVEYVCGLFDRVDQNPEKGIEYMNRKILAMAYCSIIKKQKFIKANHDRWLYTFSWKSHRQPTDWLIRALEAL